VSKPEPLQKIAQHPENADEKLSQTTISALKNMDKFAYPVGAVLSCACGCGYSKEKTPAQMNEYLKKWPRMHGLPANVRPK
jgi:hypothetical protein